MKKSKILAVAFFIALFTFSISSCREKTTGEKIKDNVEEVGDDIEEGAEEIGEEIDDATDDN